MVVEVEEHVVRPCCHHLTSSGAAEEEKPVMEVRPPLTQNRDGFLPLWTSTDPDKVTWGHRDTSVASFPTETTAAWRPAHLDHHHQKKGHVSGEVDLVELEHRSTEAEDQRRDDDLDGLQDKEPEQDSRTSRFLALLALPPSTPSLHVLVSCPSDLTTQN